MFLFTFFFLFTHLDDLSRHFGIWLDAHVCAHRWMLWNRKEYIDATKHKKKSHKLRIKCFSSTESRIPSFSCSILVLTSWFLPIRFLFHVFRHFSFTFAYLKTESIFSAPHFAWTRAMKWSGPLMLNLWTQNWRFQCVNTHVWYQRTSLVYKNICESDFKYLIYKI